MRLVWRSQFCQDRYDTRRHTTPQLLLSSFNLLRQVFPNTIPSKAIVDLAKRHYDAMHRVNNDDDRHHEATVTVVNVVNTLGRITGRRITGGGPMRKDLKKPAMLGDSITT